MTKSIDYLFAQATLDGGEGFVKGRTPLMVAAQSASTKVLSILKNWSADLNILDNNQLCAMNYALGTRDEAVVETTIPSCIPSGSTLQNIYQRLSQFEIRMTPSVKSFIQSAIKGKSLEEPRTYILMTRLWSKTI